MRPDLSGLVPNEALLAEKATDLTLSPAAQAAGFQLFHVTCAESTNAAALRAVELGADRLWIVADEQTAGRGRHGRAWQSPPGNLYASLGLAAPCPPRYAPLLGFVAGISLAEAILVLAPGLSSVLHLKWPNDCLLMGAKVAGILLEGTSLKGGETGITLGMGVNVAHFPEGLDQRATALRDHTTNIDRDRLFTTLSDRIAANLALFDQGSGFEVIRQGWLTYALPKGTRLKVKPPGGERIGAFAGIDPTGALLLETETGIEAILVGDVFPIDDITSPERAARGIE
ncbi:MAG: biotin--[acetyl-CoA-carboxylase] ligase [Rhizobiales bacterium PAR1]|nr:MAG: biotin--[acetyl-CoA-carboxylase] ligase [Rhizobiales bacterium PAR1]